MKQYSTALLMQAWLWISMKSPSHLTFKKRVFRSSFWTLAGYGVNNALRLAGNLILTRLLFPEAFGMMAIIQVVTYGLVMITDTGIGNSIVQHKRGNDPVFVNTAWTVQILRGVLVWCGFCVLALPIAEIYREPMLTTLLPVAGLTAVISALSSTKLYTAQRNLEAARITQIEVGTYALGLFITILLAWIQQSVWSLVWGQLITSGLKTIASHVWLQGINNRLAWDRGALGHLTGFGRWLLLNSTFTFLSVEGARMLIGALLDMRQLALFTLASTMNLMFWQAIQQIVWKVFFPAYSEVYRSNPKTLLPVLFKARVAFILPCWILAVLFILFGDQLMGTLYDERYLGSGFMLQQLAAGTLVACVWGSYSGVLLAIGKAKAMTGLTIMQVLFQFTGIYIGYKYAGGTGIVAGVSASSWIVYPISAIVMKRHGLWQPKLDMVFLAASILAVIWLWPELSKL